MPQSTGRFLGPISLLLGILAKVIPTGSWEPLISSIWNFLKVLPTHPYHTLLHISMYSLGPQGFSPVSVLLLPSYLIMFLLSPPGRSALPPRSLLFLSPVIAFFSLPSGTEASSLGPFSLLSFLSSVDCILVILYFWGRS